MIPLELKKDKYGLLYSDDIELVRQYSLPIDKRVFKHERYYISAFYPFKSTDEYIIKYSLTVFTKREIKKILEMLDTLVSKQKNVSNVDFPIGYYVFMKKLQGVVIKYYKDGVSLDNILLTKDIENVGKYYYHEEDNIHNLFMLFNDVLDLEYEMFENGIYYRDLNPGNLVLFNNKPKIIDFDYRYIRFDDVDCGLIDIMESYSLLLKEVLSNYKLIDGVEYISKDFDDAKEFTKKLENKVRRNIK